MSIDRDLKDMEDAIRKLKIEYDQFFAGATPTPPTENHKKVEQLVKRVGMASSMGSVEHFRYNTLLARWNSYGELWGRQIRNKEEGPRMRTQTTKIIPAKPSGPVVISDPARESGAIERLYASYVELRQRLDVEDTGGGIPPLDVFTRTIVKQTEQLIAKSHCSSVEFRVELKEGRVSLKAKASAAGSGGAKDSK